MADSYLRQPAVGLARIKAYAADCPVTDCMADSAAQWFFEPLPEPIRLILPIQVKRTNKPLHLSGAAISADLRIE